jgi:hypothetical protein
MVQASFLLYTRLRLCFAKSPSERAVSAWPYQLEQVDSELVLFNGLRRFRRRRRRLGPGSTGVLCDNVCT